MKLRHVSLFSRWGEGIKKFSVGARLKSEEHIFTWSGKISSKPENENSGSVVDWVQEFRNEKRGLNYIVWLVKPPTSIVAIIVPV